MSPLNKHELAGIFNELGLLLEVKGENAFKARAYYNAARTIESLTEGIEGLIVADRLSEIPGFGEAIVKKIIEWSQTGRVEYYEDLKNSIPTGLFELLRVPGLGPKKINVLYNELGITSLEMLETACNSNQLQSLPGFGVKTQTKLGAAIDFIKQHRGQFLLSEALSMARKMQADLQRLPFVKKVEIAGSLRRCKEIVKDIDLVAAASDPPTVSAAFLSLPNIATVIGSGPTKASVRLKSGVNVDLRVVEPREFPHAWQHFSGSREHNVALRHLAKGLGYKVNEYGLSRGTDLIYCEDEAAIYHRLGLAYIPPELREDRGEIEAAQEGKLPKLIEVGDLRGLFHVHTNYSDGAASLREMMTAAIARGYTYFNTSPYRLDLDWRWCHQAKQAGVPVVIAPDAHSIADLDLIPRGVAVARKGWLESGDVLNTKSVTAVTALLKQNRL